MPELPEVETTRRGIAPYLIGHKVTAVIIRTTSLRLPVPADLPDLLTQQKFIDVRRRGKYLFLDMVTGTLIIHLGMSGSLRLTEALQPHKKHDHVDIIIDNHLALRYHDPRRFGLMIWTSNDALSHPLIQHLGPEPWDSSFTGEYLYQRSRDREIAVKPWIMNAQLVVGVGNIYANEALFCAGIRPSRAIGNIALQRYQVLVTSIQTVLTSAITQGGTTLRDFVNSQGEPGYFSQQLNVYERAGLPCKVCQGDIASQRLGQRSTYYCPQCQR